MRPSRPTHHRRGAIGILIALMMTVIFAFVAMAVDTGYLTNTKSELQRTADSAAMAAMWEYADRLGDGDTFTNAQSAASGTASSTSLMNPTCRTATQLPNSGIEWGYVADFDNIPDALATAPSSSWVNAIRVTVEKSENSNGPLRFFFGRMAGMDSTELQCSATAALVREIRGFQSPSDGNGLGMLPIALDLQTWNNLVSGIGEDNWSWNKSTETISAGGDGVLEVSLYPTGTGMPGNRGTVDIGSNSNSTADISRQIIHGVSDSDLAYHGGVLMLDENGELLLNGDTGISAGIKDELEAIRGKPRIIPIFSQVHGPGNNAEYTIVKFVGIRIMSVTLTGKKSGKEVVIQPAAMVTKGVIPATSGADTSDYLYSNVVLVK